MIDSVSRFLTLISPGGTYAPVFVACLVIGGFVVFTYCVDQFEKPSYGADDSDPWKFIVPSWLTPRRQYLVGFSVYVIGMILLYVLVAFAGPQAVGKMVQAGVDPETGSTIARQDSSTFPIIAAFLIVGLYPKLQLPSRFDLEAKFRRFAHRIAYIPKNMDELFNTMRFSEFDFPNDKLVEAWELINLKRPTLDAVDLKSIMSQLDRLVLLYANAATFAGDLDLDDAKRLTSNLSIDVFRQYREKIAEVMVTLEAVQARLGELDGLSDSERRRAIISIQRELTKALEFLYVILACAITIKGINHLADRLRALGFTTPPPPPPEIPWNPILKVVLPSALVLGAACILIAENFGKETAEQFSIPSGIITTAQLLLTVLIVHTTAIAQAMVLRARRIASENYYSAVGTPMIVSYLSIFAHCFVSAAAWYLVIYGYSLAHGLLDPGNPPAPARYAIELYLRICFIWPIVPGITGVMTAVTIDRPSARQLERLISGVLQGSVMACAAVVAAKLQQVGTTPVGPPHSFLTTYGFYSLIYGGLGFVFGYLLPAAIRQQWRAEESRMPDRVTTLKTSVRRYFRDIQQFDDWLHTREPALDGKRPIDILAEEDGVQRVTEYVNRNRRPVAA